jgi:hypothetical protein
LLRSQEVRDIRAALQQGAITEETIHEFVSSLMKAFQVGRRFEHETALAALAVALERRSTDFAEEFLLDLARLKLAEMPICIRVARECIREARKIARNARKNFRPQDWPKRLCFRQLETNERFRAISTVTAHKVIDMRPIHAKA